VNRRSIDRLIDSSRLLSRDVDLYQFLLVSKYTSHACRAYQNYSRWILSFVFSLLFPLFFTRFFFFFIAPSFAFKFIRTHNTRARYAWNAFAWRRVRGDSTEYDIRSTLFFFFLLSSILFSRHYSTHCGCAYFLSRGRPMQIAIVLSIFWR